MKNFQIKAKVALFLIMLGTMLGLSGCGAVSQLTNSSGSSGNQGNSSAYAGTGSISGSVVVSEEDLAKIGQTNLSSQSLHSKSIKALSAEESAGISNPLELPSGTAYLYEVLSDGTVSYTGITTNVVAGAYTFSNIKEGKKYIVSIESQGRDSLGNKNELKLDSFVDLKSGSTSAISNITEKSSIVANYIVEKVVKVGGNQFESDTSQQIAQKALDAVNDMLSDGSIRRVSPVTTTQNFVESTEYTKPANASDTSLEVIDNSDTVRKISQQASLESKLQKTTYTQDQAKAIIRAIFGGSDVNDTKGSGSDNGPPEFFLDQFGAALVRGQLVSIEDFATAFNNSLPEGGLKTDYWTKANVIAQIKAVFNDSNGKVSKLYAIYNGGSDDGAISPIIRAVFPKSSRLTTPVTNTTQLNVPQMIIAMMEANLMSTPAQYQTGSHNGPPFDPFKLLKAIQYVSIVEGHYYIIEKFIAPMKVYKENVDTHRWGEVDALESRIQVYFEGNARPIGRIVLRYPKASGGTGTAEYSLRSHGGQGEGDNNMSSQSLRENSGNAQSLSPKGLGSKVVLKIKSFLSSIGITKFNSAIKTQSARAASQESGSPFDNEWVISPFSQQGGTPTYITDFKSGDATVEVYDDQDTKVTEGTMKIFKFEIDPIAWVSPRGMDMTKVQETGWDQDFIPAELDTDSSDQAQPTLQWEAPNVTLPDGYTLAYAVDLGMSASKIDFNADFGNVPGNWDNNDSQYKWKRIWSSWEEGRYIRSSSFQLKQKLNKTVRSLAQNYQTTYEVNVMPLVIETASGRVVWQGSSSRTNFFVGKSSPWSIALRGTVNFNESIFNRLNASAGTWKIGLFKMGSPGSNGAWTDAFFSSTAGGRSPVQLNGEDMVVELGSTATLQASHQASYEFPSFTKLTSPLVKFNSYRLIVWLDVSTAPSTSDWSLYGSPQANKIDFSPHSFLEYFEMDRGDIWVDPSSIQYQNHQRNSSKSLSEGSVQDQVIDLTVGGYF